MSALTSRVSPLLLLLLSFSYRSIQGTHAFHLVSKPSSALRFSLLSSSSFSLSREGGEYPSLSLSPLPDSLFSSSSSLLPSSSLLSHYEHSSLPPLSSLPSSFFSPSRSSGSPSLSLCTPLSVTSSSTGKNLPDLAPRFSSVHTPERRIAAATAVSGSFSSSLASLSFVTPSLLLSRIRSFSPSSSSSPSSPQSHFSSFSSSLHSRPFLLAFFFEPFIFSPPHFSSSSPCSLRKAKKNSFSSLPPSCSSSSSPPSTGKSSHDPFLSLSSSLSHPTCGGLFSTVCSHSFFPSRKSSSLSCQVSSFRFFAPVIPYLSSSVVSSSSSPSSSSSLSSFRCSRRSASFFSPFEVSVRKTCLALKEETREEEEREEERPAVFSSASRVDHLHGVQGEKEEEEEREGGEEEDVDVSFLLKRIEELPRAYIESLISDFRENLPHLFPSVHALFIREIHKSLTPQTYSSHVDDQRGVLRPPHLQAVHNESGEVEETAGESRERDAGILSKDERQPIKEGEQEEEKKEEGEKEETKEEKEEEENREEDADRMGDINPLPTTTISDSLFDDLSIYTTSQLRLVLKLLLQQAEKIDKEEEAGGESASLSSSSSFPGVRTPEEDSPWASSTPSSQGKETSHVGSSSSSSHVRDEKTLWERIREEEEEKEEEEDSFSSLSSSTPVIPLKEVLASRKEVLSLQDIPRYELVELLDKLSPFIAALPFDDFLNTPNAYSTDQLRDLVGIGLARMEQCTYTAKDRIILNRISQWQKRRLAYIEQVQREMRKREEMSGGSSSLEDGNEKDEENGSSEVGQKRKEQESTDGDIEKWGRDKEGEDFEGEKRGREEGEGFAREERNALGRREELREGEEGSLGLPSLERPHDRIKKSDTMIAKKNEKEKKIKTNSRWRIEDELSQLNLPAGSGVLDERQLSRLSLSMSRGVYGVKTKVFKNSREEKSSSSSSLKEGQENEPREEDNSEEEEEVDIVDLSGDERLFRIEDEEERREETRKKEEENENRREKEKGEEEIGILDRAEVEGMSCEELSLVAWDICEMGTSTLRSILSNRENAVYIHPNLRSKEALEKLDWRELRDAYTSMLRRIQGNEEIDVVQGERHIVREDQSLTSSSSTSLSSEDHGDKKKKKRKKKKKEKKRDTIEQQEIEEDMSIHERRDRQEDRGGEEERDDSIEEEESQEMNSPKIDEDKEKEEERRASNEGRRMQLSYHPQIQQAPSSSSSFSDSSSSSFSD
ncbi:dead deah box helicase domain-containing protein, partial [Cystoisospora suis]